MKIMARSTYRNGRGETVHIAGPTAVNPDWFWSLQGNWYDSEGRLLGYCRVRGTKDEWEHRPYGDNVSRNLVEELPNEPGFWDLINTGDRSPAEHSPATRQRFLNRTKGEQSE